MAGKRNRFSSIKSLNIRQANIAEHKSSEIKRPTRCWNKQAITQIIEEQY